MRAPTSSSIRRAPALGLVALAIVSCGGDPDRAADSGLAPDGEIATRDAGFDPTCSAPSELTAGGSVVVECTLRRLPEENRWWFAPAYIEGPIGCPIPDEILDISGPAHAFTFEVPADVTLDATLERVGYESGDDTGLLLYPGRGAPTDAASAHACLAIDFAGGSFPAVIAGVPVPGGTAVTFVVWNFFGEGPTDFRLIVTAHAR
jgi:hypothetical protein